MLLEEFYNEGAKSNNKAKHFYTATLAAFLVNPDLSIYDRVIEAFEAKEEYEVCAGMLAAVEFIENLYADYLKGAFDEEDEEELDITDDGYLMLDPSQHSEINRKVYEQIITEIYEQQAKAD